jgi:hypothetical protein
MRTLFESPEMQAGFEMIARLLINDWVTRIMQQHSHIAVIYNLAAGTFATTFVNGRHLKKLPEKLRAFVKHSVKVYTRLVAVEKTDQTRGEYRSGSIYHRQPEIILYFDPEPFAEYLSRPNWHTLHNFLRTRGRTLVHELRHAYDDYASSGKYTISSQAYTAAVDRRSATADPSDEKRIRAHRSYLLQPHEISARYTQATGTIWPFLHGAWTDYFAKFKEAFDGWQDMPPNVRMRLIRRLGAEWTNAHDKRPPIDINPFIKKLDAKLKAAGSDIRVSPAHGNIEVWGLQDAPPKLQTAVLNQVTYLADIFQRQVVTHDAVPGGFGFVRNKGRNIDYRISAPYRRSPRSRRHSSASA